MTLKISGKISRLKFDAKKYRLAVAKQLKEEQRRAVAAWVRAVAYNIPIYTGTARGTIAPVGKTVNEIIAVVGNKTGKETFVYKGRTYPLGFIEGGGYQKHSLRVDSSGDTLTYTFRFLETLPYVVWNSRFPAPAWMNTKNTPWHALQKGVAAYVQYAKNEIPKNIPKHTRFLRVKIIKVM